MLDKDLVQHIAKLSRLALSETEIAEFSQQLSAILASFNEIAKIDTTGIEPMITPTEMAVTIREDQVVAHGGQATTDELLQNATERVGNLFKVPPVV